jgi:hypothetical protein
MPPENRPESLGRSATLAIPELEQSKAAVLNSLASQHSRRGYEYAIERLIAWYCAEPRLTFNRSVVVKYRSFLERLSLSAATIMLHSLNNQWSVASDVALGDVRSDMPHSLAASGIRMTALCAEGSGALLRQRSFSRTVGDRAALS